MLNTSYKMVRLNFSSVNFKTRKPKGFEYKPRYYDAAKEDLARRERIAQAEVRQEKRERDNEENVPLTFGESWRRKSRRTEYNKSNKRVMLILAALVGLIFLYFRFG